MTTQSCCQLVAPPGGRDRARRPAIHLVYVLALAATALPSCGGGGGDSPTDTPRLKTETFAGTTNKTPTSCTGDNFSFTARDGAITVTLLESTDGVELFTQVCANGVDDNNCSINQTRTAVGQTVTGTRRGASNQVLAFNAPPCGPGGGVKPPAPVAFRATVTYFE